MAEAKPKKNARKRAARAALAGVRYVGRYHAVEVYAGGERYVVSWGECLATDAEHAARLLEQGGEWIADSADYDPALAPAPLPEAPASEEDYNDADGGDA